MEEYKGAWANFDAVCNLRKKLGAEKYLEPFAKYRMLQIKLARVGAHIDPKEYEEYRKDLKDIKKHSGYDFEKPLRRKVAKVKDLLKKKLIKN